MHVMELIKVCSAEYAPRLLDSASLIILHVNEKPAAGKAFNCTDHGFWNILSGDIKNRLYIICNIIILFFAMLQVQSRHQLSFSRKSCCLFLCTYL